MIDEEEPNRNVFIFTDEKSKRDTKVFEVNLENCEREDITPNCRIISDGTTVTIERLDSPESK